MRELAICLHKTVQRFGAGFDDVEAAIQILIRSNARDELGPERARNRLDGGKRIVDLVAKHADEPLPGLPLLFPQRRAYIGQQQQRMGHAALAKGAAVHHPAGISAILFQLDNALVRLIEQARQAQIRRRLPYVVSRQCEDVFRCRIHQAKHARRIERKDRRVDRTDNAAQQRRGLQCARALILQHVGEGIDLNRQLTEDVAGRRTARAEGIVVLTQSAHYIGQCLQRANDVFDEQTIDDERDEENDTEKREPQAGGSVLRDQQTAACQQSGQRDAHGKHAQAGFEAQPLDGSRAPHAAARSMNAYAPVSRRPL